MHAGKLVFAQVVDSAPWHTFRRLVTKYRGDFNVRTFSCLDQFLSMAFAQITFRESLRDIEAWLEAHATKAYHLGLRGHFTPSNLADANERCAWRLHCEFAQALIRIARRVYAGEPLGLELDNTVYALDFTAIDLCLTLFPWAPFRSTKAAIKLHTLLDLRGNIPSFIRISDGKSHEVNVLDLLIVEAGAFYVMDRGVPGFRPTVRIASKRWVLRHAREAQHELPLCVLRTGRSMHRTDLRSRHRAEQLLRRPRLSRAAAPSAFQGPTDRQVARVLDRQLRYSSIERLRVVQEPLAGGVVLQEDQTASADQTILRHSRERREKPSLDRRRHLCTGGHRSKAPEVGFVVACDVASFERDAFRENPFKSAVF